MRVELLPRQVLIDGLLRSAIGMDRTTAAIDLVVWHGFWLSKKAFLACVQADLDEGVVYASVDWGKAAGITGGFASSELAVLRIATSIVDFDVQISLGAEISHLGSVNSAAVVRALAAAAGQPDLVVDR